MIAGLTDIVFAEKDPDVVKSQIIADYEVAAGRSLALGDPVRIFLETIAYEIVQLRNAIDYTGKQNLLAYASGQYLEHLGALLAVSRKQAEYALTTIRFTLSAAQSSVVSIPVGTRATSDNKIVFATTQLAIINPGDTVVDVKAQCQTAGTIGNDVVIGAINKLVDLVPYVASASNITITSGGADIEDDDSLRERIHAAPEKFTNAGSRGAYEFWAKEANNGIADVTVISPSAGVVEIYPLMAGGQMPTSDVIDEIISFVNADSIRPLTDQVNVLQPVQVMYDISVTYYISSKNAAGAENIKTAVQGAVNAFALWQKSELGRDLEPSELIALMRNAGAKRVEVSSPVFRSLDRTSVAIDNSISCVFGGFES